VATVLGLPLARQPTLTMLAHYLRTKRLLLILDNCEHLILACAELADALLRACPDLHILATSREGLGVAGELTWPVPTLQMPDTAAQPTLATLATFEAVRLFVDRAALVSPGFALTVANAAAVRQICTRLDGIPLAIELAAARVKTLAASDSAARLGDRFRLLTGGSRTVQPRHQTLRALIDWSYQLLTESERGVLRRLAIFAGGWTLEAAGAVCADDGIDARDVLDVLTRLVDKSLVVPDPRSAGTRYYMLETIRQYLVEQLEAAEERAAVRGRHLDYMLAFSEHLAPQLGENELYGDWSAPQPGEEGVIDPVIAYTRLAADLENIRYALEWAAETGRIDAGLRILIALSTLFIMRAGEKELLARFQAMLEALAPPGDMRTHARACLWVVYLYHRKADIDQGRGWLDKAKTLIAQLDTPVLQFSLLSFWTSGAYIRGDYTLAHVYLEQQRNLAMAHDYFGRGKEDIEDALAWQHSYLLLLEHDYMQAKQRLQPSHARNIKLGNLYLSTALARLLGYALLYTGDVDEAAERFHESMRGNFALGDKQAVAACLSAVAAFALAHGELPRAARLFGASEALQEAIYTPVSTWDSEQVQRNVAILRQKLPSPELDAHWAAGRALSMEQAIDDALAMDP
jgi:non-specific serine/threonine protein kinase